MEWIEGELSSLEKMSDNTKRQIETIREYRTRLIADVVTGKLDVREAAAGLPEVDPLAEEHADDPIDTDVDSSLEELDAVQEVTL